MADASGTADLITAYVGIATAAGTAIWAVSKYLADRRDAREKAGEDAERSRRQQHDEEVRARQDRAAALIRAVGEATDPSTRRWTISALSLYPEEALTLLLMSLGEAGAEDSASIALAVLSMGPAALPETVRTHRIARQVCATAAPPDASEPGPAREHVDVAQATHVLEGTRGIIVNLLLQLDEEGRAAVDLAGVDLSGANLARARLSRIRLRKTRLDGADLAHARLTGAVLRGAGLEGTVLTRAALPGADLTGAAGRVQAIRADLSDAILDQARLGGAALDAARLAGATLRQTDLTGASLPGAVLTHATLDRATLSRVTAHHLAAGGMQVAGSDLSHADLAHARLSGSRFERSRLVRVAGADLRADRAVLVDTSLAGASLPRATLVSATITRCNLGGADLSRGDLSGAALTRCDLSGTVLSSATLAGSVLDGCHVARCDLTGATLTGATFRGCAFERELGLTGVDLTGVTFEACTFAEGLVIRAGESWRSAVLDDAAREAFGRISATAVGGGS